jgi:dihydrofolate reductase/thymidylate synthase
MRAIATAVLAKDSANGISFKGNIPWPSLKQSAELIEKHTKDHIIIMGRKTWDTIPRNQKPIAGRINYVISRKLSTLDLVREYGSGVVVFRSLDEAMLSAVAHNADKKIFIMGGGEILKEAFSKNLVGFIYLTDIQNKYEADMFIKFPTNFDKIETTDVISQEIPGTSTKTTPNEIIRYQVILFKIAKNIEEMAYLEMLGTIIDQGMPDKISDYDVVKLFGTQLSFNLENSFPRFTTRKTPVKGAFLELMWLLRGDTDLKYLHEHKIHINDKYATEGFHKERGFDYKMGEIGRCEGYQWRNFSGDQLANVVNQLKEKSGDFVMISWNPLDLPKMAIKPKTIAIQYNINRTRLDCRVILNTVDMIGQFPMIVSAYSLMTLLVAKMSKLQPGKITFQMGVSYIRESHINNAKYESERTPFPFPLVGIRRELMIEHLDTFDVDEDIVWDNYVYHEGLAYSKPETPVKPETPTKPEQKPEQTAESTTDLSLPTPV